MPKLIHFKCDKYVEVEGDKVSLTKTTPPEAPRWKHRIDTIKTAVQTFLLILIINRQVFNIVIL